MKKVIMGALFGIALTTTVSHAQGYIAMHNYVVVAGIPVFSAVTYTPGGQYIGVASGFKADLLYSFTGQPGSFTLAAGSQTPFWPGSVDGGSPTTDGAGVFFGPTVAIPGYVSGPVTFIVEAYNGSSYGQVGKYNGLSAPFTIPSLQTNPLLTPGDILNVVGTTATGLQPFALVPEPSLLALAGLGAAGLTAFRRKK